jgi:HK97 family phage prohead protease
MMELRELPDNYRPALEADVPEGRACGNCVFYDEDNRRDDQAFCTRWNEYVSGAYYCNAWQSDDEDDERTAMSDLEFRTFDADITEVRAAEDGKGMTFGGYAWKYDSPSLPLPFTERIAPGAFTRSLKSRAEIRAYVNHDDTLLLGSRRAGTLRIDDRADGGWVEIDLPDTSWGRDIRTLVERGDIGAQGNGGMSFGFSTVKDKWNDDGTERTLVEAKLWEVSVVTSTSAYMSTTASMVRSVGKLARRTSTDADELAEAMTALQAGEMNEHQAALLRTVVDQISPQAPTPEPTTPMSVLAAKLSLAEKALGL